MLKTLSFPPLDKKDKMDVKVPPGALKRTSRNFFSLIKEDDNSSKLHASPQVSSLIRESKTENEVTPWYTIKSNILALYDYDDEVPSTNTQHRRKNKREDLLEEKEKKENPIKKNKT